MSRARRNLLNILRRPTTSLEVSMQGTSYRIFYPQQPIVFPIEELPERTFNLLLSYLEVSTLGNLGLVNKTLNERVLTYATKVASSRQLFYTFHLVGPSILLANMGFYKLSWEESDRERNFSEVGVMMKRLTMLKPTLVRLDIVQVTIESLLGQLDLTGNKPAIKLAAIFFHSFVAGWTVMECEAAASKICLINLGDQSRVEDKMAVFLDPEYNLGVETELELVTRDLLTHFFFPKFSKEKRMTWLLILFKIFAPHRQTDRIAKLLMLSTAPRKKKNITEGLSWQDNIDAVPACIRVARFRYDELVYWFQALQRLGGFTQDDRMKLLDAIFTTPEPWLPENMASFLILGGNKVIKQYLEHSLKQVLQTCGETDYKFQEEDFSQLGDIFLGLFLMQSRFKRDLELMMVHMDDLVAQIPTSARKSFSLALWESITKEFRDIRENEEDEWSEDSSRHVLHIIQHLGLRSTMKAYNPKPKRSRMEE